MPVAPAGNCEYAPDIFLFSHVLKHEQKSKTHFVLSTYLSCLSHRGLKQLVHFKIGVITETPSQLAQKPDWSTNTDGLWTTIRLNYGSNRISTISGVEAESYVRTNILKSSKMPVIGHA